ncbi:MAG: hypothetical protein ABI723_08990 [Bacteroidia bacterium]
MSASKNIRSENSPELKQFIRDYSWLWWYIPEKKKENLSHEVVVEFVLNYGDEKMVKRLFEILGVDHVAEIFYAQTAVGRRVNYFAPVVNFFNLYFKRHAFRNPHTATN